MDTDKKVKIRQALNNASSCLDKDQPLPKYLEKALLQYEDAFWKDVTKRIIAPKLVHRFHRQGMPLSKKSRQKGAYEAAANLLNCSESTVERAYDEFPPKQETESD